MTSADFSWQALLHGYESFIAFAIGCTLPTAGRVGDFHPLERVPAGHTKNAVSSHSEDGITAFHIQFCETERAK